MQIPISVSAYMFSVCQCLQMLSYERDDLPAVEVFPGRFAAGVVAAGKPRDINGNVEAFELTYDVAREMRRKSQIVACGDKTHRHSR